MKKVIKIQLLTILVGLNFISCKQSTQAQNNNPNRNLSEQFKAYWYQGNAEISTYELSENRYGELRNGKATLIYVTEDFVADKQVKADYQNPNNKPVLKLNSVKKFITGVYPYSIMQSSFIPLQEEGHALKISSSIQEWCGQTFIQLNNKDVFEINSFSYFESEGDTKTSLPKAFTENEIWNLIRVNGLNDLPSDEVNMIPSFEFLKLNHVPLKAYKATINSSTNNGIINYTINYPELNRKLSINFEQKFPFIIKSWSDQIGNKQPSTAKLITTKKLPYWGLKSLKHETIRNELGL